MMNKYVFEFAQLTRLSGLGKKTFPLNSVNFNQLFA